MAFIITIVLAILVFGKIALDKTEKNMSDKEFEKGIKTFSEAKELWFAKVIDEQLEIQLEQMIYTGENRDSIMSEVKQSYAEMGKEYRYLPNKTETLRILLARRGKLRRADAENGIANFISPLTPTVVEGRKNYEALLKFAIWINQQLNKHGVNEEFLFVRVNGEIISIDSSKWQPGYYKWKPAIMKCSMQ